MAIVGETINGRYTDTHIVLGKGSYASVRLGELQRPNGDDEWCALKFPQARCAADLEAEIDILGKLEHPNVVALMDVLRSSQDGKIIMVIPYAHFDLSSYLLSQRMHDDVARGVSRQVAEGVKYVHAQRIIHRDIKPGNILLFMDSGSSSPSVDAGETRVALRVWLSDFDMAREVSAVAHRAMTKSKMTTVTAPMTTHVCTSWYRAPEVLVATTTPDLLDAYVTDAKEKIKYGMSMDVWSYGAVVYEMLAGKPLARAADGAGIVALLLGTLGPCPTECLYSALPEWVVLTKVARELETSRQRIPAEWAVPAACLK